MLSLESNTSQIVIVRVAKKTNLDMITESKAVQNDGQGYLISSIETPSDVLDFIPLLLDPWISTKYSRTRKTGTKGTLTKRHQDQG